MVVKMPAPMKHPRTGVYWFRKVIPPHLRPVMGRREIQRTLGTKDLREAKRRWPAVAEQVEREIALAERQALPTRLTLQQIVALSGEWYRAALAKQEADPATVEEYDLLIDQAAEAHERGRIREYVKPTLDPLLAETGLVPDATSCRDLENRLFWDMIQLWNTLKRRSLGDYTPDPHLDTLPRWQEAAPKASPSQAQRGPTFEALIEGWALDAAPTPSVKTMFTRYLRTLGRHLGIEDLTETDALQVTRTDLIAFKEARLKAGKAPKTVASEIAGIAAVFSWAFQNEKIPANPAIKITVGALRAAKRRGEKARYPYTPEEALTILRAARKEQRPDTRWLPWLCAFTGARISEAAGLRPCDIEQIDGAWFVAIGLSRQQAKSASSRRRVPLHPALIEEGFLDFARPSASTEALFPKRSSENVARWIRETVRITDKKKGPSHSWRHRFEDEGRAAGIEEDIRDALAGHSNPSIGREYGTGYTDPRLLHRLVEAINKLPVPVGL